MVTFWHGDLSGFADDPVARVAADANAAAHGEALQESDDGFGVVGDFGVEAVFVAPEIAAIVRSPAWPLVYMSAMSPPEQKARSPAPSIRIR